MTKSVLCVVGILALTGCMSVQRDGFKMTSLGQDIKGTIEYARVDTNGTAEVLSFTGSKNASESTHTVANAACAIIGAIIGAGTPATPAGGAAIGLGTSEVWQTVKDWAKAKIKKTEPKTASEAPVVDWLHSLPDSYKPTTNFTYTGR